MKKYKLWIDLPKALAAANVEFKVDKLKQVAIVSFPTGNTKHLATVNLVDTLLNSSNLPKDIVPRFIGEQLMAPVEFFEQYLEAKTEWDKSVEYLIIITSQKTIITKLVKLLGTGAETIK